MGSTLSNLEDYVTPHRAKLRTQGSILHFDDPDLLAKLEHAVQECDLDATRVHLHDLLVASEPATGRNTLVPPSYEELNVPDTPTTWRNASARWLLLFPWLQQSTEATTLRLNDTTNVSNYEVTPKNTPHTISEHKALAAAAQRAALLCACIYQRHGSDPNTCPLLHVACMHSGSDAGKIVAELCNAGADPSGTNAMGEYPRQEVERTDARLREQGRGVGDKHVSNALTHAFMIAHSGTFLKQGPFTPWHNMTFPSEEEKALDTLRKEAYHRDMQSVEYAALSMRRVHALEAHHAVMTSRRKPDEEATQQLDRPS